MADFKNHNMGSRGPNSGKYLDSSGKAHDMARKFDSLIDPLSNLRVARQIPIFDLKSNFGISEIRDQLTELGSGSVTNDSVRYELSTGTTSSSVAAIRSVERGRYVTGTTAVAGLGVRVPEQSFSEGQDCRWGYFDTDNGFFFGKDHNGMYVGIKKGGSVNKIHRSEWNKDLLDGSNDQNSNPSGMQLDPSGGHIYRIIYNWYGFGDILFRVAAGDQENDMQQEVYTVHAHTPEQHSVNNPNLPVKASAGNGATTNDTKLEVFGRQYHIMGEDDPVQRRTPVLALNKSVSPTEDTPLVSYRYKDSLKEIEAGVLRYATITDQDLVVKVIEGGSLTGASWSSPDDIPASETAVEVDSDATAHSGGRRKLDQALVSSGQGGQTEFFQQDRIDVSTREDDIITVTARAIEGSTANVSCNLILEEEW